MMNCKDCVKAISGFISSPYPDVGVWRSMAEFAVYGAL